MGQVQSNQDANDNSLFNFVAAVGAFAGGVALGFHFMGKEAKTVEKAAGKAATKSTGNAVEDLRRIYGDQTDDILKQISKNVGYEVNADNIYKIENTATLTHQSVVDQYVNQAAKEGEATAGKVVDANYTPVEKPKATTTNVKDFQSEQAQVNPEKFSDAEDKRRETAHSKSKYKQWLKDNPNQAVPIQEELDYRNREKGLNTLINRWNGNEADIYRHNPELNKSIKRTALFNNKRNDGYEI